MSTVSGRQHNIRGTDATGRGRPRLSLPCSYCFRLAKTVAAGVLGGEGGIAASKEEQLAAGLAPRPRRGASS